MRKKIIYDSVRDEVRVRELFARLLEEHSMFPYRILKSYATVEPKFPDYILKDLRTGKRILADAKEICREDDLSILRYIREGVTVFICWYNAFSESFIEKHGLEVIELRDYFYEPMSYFEERLYPIIKSQLEEKGICTEWIGKKSNEETEAQKNLYKFVARKDGSLMYYNLYCDENGLTRYEELYAEEAMINPEMTIRYIVEKIFTTLVPIKHEID